MQKCTDSSFCNRLRGVKGPALEVLQKSIDTAGLTATAKLHDSRTESQLDLALTAYEGVVRLRITEAAKQRFEVPDTLQPKFVEDPLSWSSKKASSKSLSLQLGTAALTLEYQPFRLSLSVAGLPAVDINSRSLFNYEQKRDKQVGTITNLPCCVNRPVVKQLIWLLFCRFFCCFFSVAQPSTACFIAVLQQLVLGLLPAFQLLPTKPPLFHGFCTFPAGQ